MDEWKVERLEGWKERKERGERKERMGRKEGKDGRMDGQINLDKSNI